MKKIKKFQDLLAWQEANKLVTKIYKITKSFPHDEKYIIISQLKNASTSITANIAEGFGRYYFKDKNKFYYQARASLHEVKNFIITANNQKYINDKELNIILQNINLSGKLINGLIRSNIKQINKENNKLKT